MVIGTAKSVLRQHLIGDPVALWCTAPVIEREQHAADLRSMPRVGWTMHLHYPLRGEQYNLVVTFLFSRVLTARRGAYF